VYKCKLPFLSKGSAEFFYRVLIPKCEKQFAIPCSAQPFHQCYLVGANARHLDLEHPSYVAFALFSDYVIVGEVLTFEVNVSREVELLTWVVQKGNRVVDNKTIEMSATKESYQIYRFSLNSSTTGMMLFGVLYMLPRVVSVMFRIGVPTWGSGVASPKIWEGPKNMGEP